jgi:hypothetical protein
MQTRKIKLDEYFLQKDLEKIVKAFGEKGRVDICSFCMKSTSGAWPCMHDCAGIFEALVRESKAYVRES